MKKIIYNVKRYGFRILIIRLLVFMHVIDRSKMYEMKSRYLKKINRDEYEDELIAWFNMKGGDDNLREPQTFSGKINWLKIHDASPMKTRLADKYLVRDWIKEKIGEKYLIDLLGVYDDYKEIDFDILPEKFVIKANHGSGMNIIIKDKKAINRKKIKKETTRWLNTVFGYEGMEIHYFDIPRKILIEKYIEEMDGNLMDYKIHCFNGIPRYIQVIGRSSDRLTASQTFFDVEWKKTDFTNETYPSFDYELEKPSKLDEMIDVARELSEDFCYVRVDLYLIGDNVKFGEMTFTPASGMMKWVPEQAAYDLGNLIELPLG